MSSISRDSFCRNPCSVLGVAVVGLVRSISRAEQRARGWVGAKGERGKGGREILSCRCEYRRNKCPESMVLRRLWMPMYPSGLISEPENVRFIVSIVANDWPGLSRTVDTSLYVGGRGEVTCVHTDRNDLAVSHSCDLMLDGDLQHAAAAAALVDPALQQSQATGTPLLAASRCAKKTSPSV